MKNSKTTDQPDLVARVLGGKDTPPNNRLTAAAKADYAREVASSNKKTRAAVDDTPAYKRGGMVKKPGRK